MAYTAGGIRRGRAGTLRLHKLVLVFSRDHL